MTFTPEHAKQYAEILEALAEDGAVEVYDALSGIWNVCHVIGSKLLEPQCYRRISKPITTTPITQQIRVEDLPPNCHVKLVGDDTDYEYLITARSPKEQQIEVNGVWCSIAAMKDAQYSSDLKTWHPFTVTETAKEVK